MARTKTNTHNNTKTHRTPRRNRHLEKKLFCVFLSLTSLEIDNCYQNVHLLS